MNDDFDRPCETARAQPHDIKFSPDTRVVVDSATMGWRDAYASITSRRAWMGRIFPIEHLGVGYCLRGVNTIERRLEGAAAPENVEFSARQLALLPSHAPAWYRVAGDADVLMVYLRSGMVRAVADRLFGASTKPLHFKPVMAFNDPMLEQICLVFAAALYGRDPVSSRYVDQLAEAAAAHCLVRYGDAPATAPATPRESTDLQTALERVRGYVDDNLEGDLSVETLADAARLPPSGLKRAFALVYGTTPRQWIIQRRIASAEQLLAGTDLPLAEIALRTGFASQSHMSSMFKREIGRTPRGYRRAE